MMANHPESCIVCNQGNRCELRQIAADLGVGEIDLYPMPHYAGLEAANPFIIRDLSKCILCGRCIRADHELVVVGAIDYHLRGFESRPAAVHNRPLEQSSCTFCGTCVSICPTGALMAKSDRFAGSPEQTAPTVCGFCGVGCALIAGSMEGRVMEVNPAHAPGTVNGSTLCIRGHFAHDFLNARERLVQPRIRKDGDQVDVSWDEALDTVATRLREIKQDYGPAAIGLFGSSKCTNEENYLFQKIGRVQLETHNVDNGGSLAARAALRNVEERVGGALGSHPLSSLEAAQCILVLGADPAHSLPVVSYTIKRAARKEIPLIVADPRRTELTPFCSLWLSLSPHSDLALINGLASLLWERRSYDADYVDQYTEGFDRYRQAMAELDLEQVFRRTGLDRSALERAADLLHAKKVAVVVGRGILEQPNGPACMDALLNLTLMTGSLGMDGGGFHVLARENNQVGAWDMGAAHDTLPGRASLKNETARKQWERAWQTRLSPDEGLHIIRMIEEAEKGNLKALWVMGENPLRSLPQSARIQKAFEKLDLLVVQDILDTETAQQAHVVLPGAAFSEKSGTFTNMEGRIQSFDAVGPPPGHARPDWEILDDLAVRLGQDRPYGAVERIRTEIARLVPAYGGLEDKESPSWVSPVSDRRLFRTDGQGDPIPFSGVDSPAEQESDTHFPFTAILGSLRYHCGSGTRSGLSGRIRQVEGQGRARISPDDGTRLGLEEGDSVRIQSAAGSVVRKIHVDKGLTAGLVVVPLAVEGNDAADLVPLIEPGGPDQPGYAAVAVKLEKV
jgi:predicted molibdopterin-dependent oxidoreductase YjgC